MTADPLLKHAVMKKMERLFENALDRLESGDEPRGITAILNTRAYAGKHVIQATSRIGMVLTVLYDAEDSESAQMYWSESYPPYNALKDGTPALRIMEIADTTQLNAEMF